MVTLMAVVVLAIVPRGPVVETKCDVIEINHFFDDNGNPVFTQAIFYRWCDTDCRHHVVAWRLLDRLGAHLVGPAKDRGLYFVAWVDGDRLRRVWGASLRESWTQFDPELSERRMLPSEQRTELGK